MKTSFNYMQKFFILLMMGFSLCAIQACSGDDDSIDNPAQNTKDIAVTGSVDEYGCTFAKISGYANLNLLPAGSGNPQIGMEICMADEEDYYPKYEIATSMTGNCFSVEFRSLNPEMKYKYRSFVEYAGIKHYGEYKIFTTKQTSTLISTGGVTDVTFVSATISSTLNNLKEDFYKVGVLCSTSKSALYPDSINSWYVDEEAIYYYELEENDYTVTFENLEPATTYYYASFVYIIKDYYLAEIKSFTTKGFSNLITTGDVSDISISTATVAFNVVTDAIDENLNLGIAYSTSEAALRPDGVFHVEEFSKKDVAAGICSVTLKDLSPSTTYYYASFVELNGKYSFEEIKSFTTKEYIPESVDLGLSVKWACCNVGASSPEGYGGYYAWGETEEKSDYDWDTYKYYNNNTGCINIGSNISGTQYDVAHVKWGGSWRMPTLNEIKELVNKCTWKWTTLNGVYGQFVTGPNGNSIFLPDAGYRYGTGLGSYWSATLNEDDSRFAVSLNFYDGRSYWNGYWDRYFGLTVRPVTE